MRERRAAPPLLPLLLLCAVAPRAAQPPAATRSAAQIKSTFWQDTGCFTQGFLWSPSQQAFFQSCGMYGQSNIRKVSTSGAVLASKSLEGRFFAEGLTEVGDKLYQLTWNSKIGIIYSNKVSSTEPFRELQRWAYGTEGWGIAVVPRPGAPERQALAVTDGSSSVYFYDPDTLERFPERVSVVNDAGGAVSQLNELEYINGYLWANIWYSDEIVVIDLSSGRVVHWLNCAALKADAAARYQTANVVNGIAYDAAAGRLWLTGKYWPLVYEVEMPAELVTSSSPPSLPGQPVWTLGPTAATGAPSRSPTARWDEGTRGSMIAFAVGGAIAFLAFAGAGVVLVLWLRRRSVPASPPSFTPFAARATTHPDAGSGGIRSAPTCDTQHVELPEQSASSLPLEVAAQPSGLQLAAPQEEVESTAYAEHSSPRGGAERGVLSASPSHMTVSPGSAS
eukprot:TRINITY_DN1830_c0_g1_i6.p1 TRINITY_DN1830_c0_g1~~TRINITY_DN1830_c0_g1_i6.p1  ORF type:complete len:474 (+),score=109.80 TRINITY_DN1830_c0_g1_i6:74-1423(+)